MGQKYIRKKAQGGKTGWLKKMYQNTLNILEKKLSSRYLKVVIHRKYQFENRKKEGLVLRKMDSREE